jgi:hypothetical protein
MRARAPSIVRSKRAERAARRRSVLATTSFVHVGPRVGVEAIRPSLEREHRAPPRPFGLEEPCPTRSSRDRAARELRAQLARDRAERCRCAAREGVICTHETGAAAYWRPASSAGGLRRGFSGAAG